jgi:hypothetical protein
LGKGEDCSVPAVIFDNSSNDENSLSLDRWRVTSGERVVRSKISSELRRRDDSKLEVWESVRRRKGIICVREATKGRGGLPVKDGVVKAVPEGKWVSETSKEGGQEVDSLVFVFFSSVPFFSLLCQGNLFLVGRGRVSDIVSFV